MAGFRVVTTSELDEVVASLYSEKAKTREEGVKMLTTILESAAGLMVLDQQTALLDSTSRITAWSWPGVADALCQCIDTEVGASKKRGPKPALAKALRNLVQKAEDPGRPGKSLVLLRKINRVMKHVLYVLQEVPSFTSDYSHILRQFLLNIEYRVRLNKKLFTALVELFFEKVKATTSGDGLEVKEEAFQSAITLHALLQNPPGDLSDVNYLVVDSFQEIFFQIRDEGRLAKKLLAALNVFLLSNGLNVADAVIKLHSSVRQFFFRTWLTTRDRELKDGLVLYARAQLQLRYILASEDTEVVEELMELVEKELDQSGIALVGLNREDRLGLVSRSMRCFLELAAAVIFEAHTRKSPINDRAKRRRTSSIYGTVKDRLSSGKCFWIAAVCMVVHRRGSLLQKPILFGWLQGLAGGIERVLADASNSRSPDILLWTLRCFQEFACQWPRATMTAPGRRYQTVLTEDEHVWQSTWNSLLHWVPLLSNMPMLVEEAFKLLGCVVTQDLVYNCNIPHEFWSTQPFSEMPSGHALYFVTAVFSSSTNQSATREDTKLRNQLIDWTLTAVDAQGTSRSKGGGEIIVSPRLLSAALLALSTGTLPYSVKCSYGSDSTSISLLDDLGCCLEPEVLDRVDELELSALNRSEDILAASGDISCHKISSRPSSRSSPLPRSKCGFLLQQTSLKLVERIKPASILSISQLCHMIATVSACIDGVEGILRNGGQEQRDWCPGGRLWKALANMVERCISLIDSSENVGTSQVQQLPSVLVALQQMTSFGGRAPLVQANGLCGKYEESICAEPLLEEFVHRLCETLRSSHEAAGHFNGGSAANTQFMEPDARTRILDSDLDAAADTACMSADRLDSMPGNIKTLSQMIDRGAGLQTSWRLMVVQIISAIGLALPDFVINNLVALVSDEKDSKMRLEMLREVFRLMTLETLPSLTSVIKVMQDSLTEFLETEASKYGLLAGIDLLFTNLLRQGCGRQISSEGRKCCSLPQQVSSQISNLFEKVADSGMVLWPTRLIMGTVLASFVPLDAATAQIHIDRLLGLLNDPEYRVRLKMSKIITVLFETWDGHVELLQDISLNLGLPTLKAPQDNVNSALNLSPGAKTRALENSAETAVITLGQLAFATSKVETEVVFMICTHAATSPHDRTLVIAVLDRLSKRLQYATRFKYLEQLIGGVLHRWVLSAQPLASILGVQHILAGNAATQEFLQHCCPWLIPSLLLEGDVDEIKWISNVVCEPVPAMLKRHFSATFAALLLSHVDGSEADKGLAASVLQGSLLRIMEVTEDERDKLIRKNMVSIVHSLFRFCSGEDGSQRPYFSRAAVASALQTVVDGFLEQDQAPQDGKIVDKLQVFRPDRVFGLLLQIHQSVQVACDPRHRRCPLASLGVLLDTIDQRSLVPSTFRYLVHIILESITIPDLQEQCCLLLEKLLDKVDACPDEEPICVLGDQLQLIVSRLVSCYAEGGLLEKPDGETSDHKVFLLSLLQRITVDAHPTLHRYIKELDRFPDLPALEPMRFLQVGSTLATEFVQFVKRAPNLSPQVRMTSLQSLCRQLRSRKKELNDMTTEGGDHEQHRCRSEFVSAVWDLLHFCEEQDKFDVRDMAAEFLAAINIGDTHGQVSLLPEGFKDVSIDAEQGVHDDTVKRILIQLHGYLTDGDVSNIGLAYNTIKGILATEKGHRVFQTMDSRTKSYLKVCSKGVNQALVEGILAQARLHRESQPIPLEETRLWETSSKTYGVWICSLVHSLVEHTEDTIARLCQEIMLHKTALAELMFPHILGLLAGKPDSEFSLCGKISEQVAEYVFSGGNKCTRSIQLFLQAMNCLRVGYVATRMRQSPSTGKRRDNSKGDRGVSSSGKSPGSRKSGSLGGSIDSSNGNCQIVLDWRKVYWLQIDYLRTAEAAQQCAAYYSSALYVEHWCEETYGTMTLGEPDFSSDDALPPHVELLLTVCTKTSERDSIYGVVRSHKLLSQLLVHENEGNWSKAVEGYDLLLRNSRIVLPGTELAQPSVRGENKDWKYYKGLMKSLQQMGCSHVLAMYYIGLAQQKPAFLDDTEFKELQFEAAWRAGKWDLDCLAPENGTDHSNLIRNSSYHANLYSCLRSLLEGDEEIFSVHLKHARQDIVSSIAHASMESSQNVNPDIVRLKVLDCLSQAWEMRWRRHVISAEHDVHQGRPSLQQARAGPHVPSDEEILQLEQVCQESLKQMRMHYNLVEHMAAFCKTLYGVISRKDRVPCYLLEFARLSRKVKRANHAAISLHELKIISSELMSKGLLTDAASSDLSKTLSAGKVEEAKLLWAQGHQELALNLARFVAKSSEVNSDLAVITCLTGKWLSETRSESSRDILDNYFKKAVELVGSSEIDKTSSHHNLWTQRQCRTHFHLAHYTDALYRSYEERLSSTEWKSALTLRQHKTRELEKLKKRLKAAAQVEQQHYLMRCLDLQKQLALDSEEAHHLQEDKNLFLSTCLRSYTTCLTTGNKYDLRVVFRLVSLWFNLPSNPEVVQQMRSTAQEVQSYKFLPLVYQIASRMGNYRESQGSLTFQQALVSLVEKMVVDHPYHSLYQLLALANGDRVKAQQRSRNAFVVDMDKKQAAETLLLRVQSFHPMLLQQMRKMVEMYIRLAELETKKEQTGKKIAVPRDVRSVRQLELVPVITAHVPVDPSCSYSQGTYPYFQGLSSDGIQVMHGVNAPKVIDCLGSDGQKYRQLAKSGDDDLRQDAVMEQLFGLVNTLLQDHPETRKRCLSIRTYKVVPFTPTAGVLEWVNGTIPLGEYLLGGGARTGGAHGRYGEDDWTFSICREKMASEKDKRKTFEKVCQKFRPVMHYFFIEQFCQPAEWFEKRLAYTRSVAASSMVGYIVGLGDRHSMNILLDQATAEVVHIDLGVAFEQGLMLKTPERVPFRLTRDLIDGMGVSGVEGVFRRCCEATLSVMRMNKEALLTIIEVFIHDPLYRWALSPLKALQRQQDVSDGEDDSYLEDDDELPAELEGNKDAARALLRVKQKLDGYEGEMRSLEGQVQQLIQDAQEPERLCQMFPGWGAWL